MQENTNFSSVLHVALVDNETAQICIYVIYSVLCQAIALFGVVTNIINIICFVKQGFKDSVNVSLMGLTVSDLCGVITVVFTNISVMPVVNTADLPFDVLGVYYLVIAMPHFTFSRVSAWITAIITLERCLCIIAPLQVKIIVTSKRMSVVIVCVYMFLISSGAPVYVVNRLDMIFYPTRNRMILGLVSTSDKETVEKITFALNNFAFPFTAFAVIIVCTAVLAMSLRRRTEWRQKSTANLQNDVNTRNKRVAKMVVMVSTLFISCFIPISVIFLVLALEPNINVYGKQVNVGYIAGGIGIFIECINSSVNIFIYYNMSMKYRNTCNKVFDRFKCVGASKL